jgi:hypothetical protein
MQIGNYKVQLLLSGHGRMAIRLVRDTLIQLWRFHRCRPNQWQVGSARHYEVGPVDLRVEHPDWIDDGDDRMPF